VEGKIADGRPLPRSEVTEAMNAGGEVFSDEWIRAGLEGGDPTAAEA
jgi:hypothetical protein